MTATARAIRSGDSGMIDSDSFASGAMLHNSDRIHRSVGQAAGWSRVSAALRRRGVLVPCQATFGVFGMSGSPDTMRRGGISNLANVC